MGGGAGLWLFVRGVTLRPHPQASPRGTLKHMQGVLGPWPPPSRQRLVCCAVPGTGAGGSRLCTVAGARAEAMCHDSTAVSQ